MSALSRRLSTLRRQSGAEASAPASPAAPSEDLGRRLHRLGRPRPGGGGPRGAGGEPQLAQGLGGDLDGAGFIRIQRRLTLDEGDEAAGALEFFGAEGPALLLDTETTGLAGGTGTLPFLIGLARLAPGEVLLEQYLVTRYGGEAGLLAAVAEGIPATGTRITYNGKSFDAPLLSTRYRLAGHPDPFARWAHLDLLHPVRAAFRERWPDCRLQTAERLLLGIRRHNDRPGSEAPAAWNDWLRQGATGPLQEVVRHNRHDLVNLGRLLLRLPAVFQDPLSYDADPLASARMFCRQGREDRAFHLLRRHRPELAAEARMVLATLARRRRDWGLATALWEELAEAGDARALEHLAKYHEHVARDRAAATQCTQRLLALGGARPAHLRRLNRLQSAAGWKAPERA